MARIKTLAGHTVEQHSSPNVGGKMTDHRGLVLHIAEGSYTGTINWQMNPDQRYSSGGTVTTSSTWVVGRNTGEVAQMSDSDTVAWCQRSGSYTWNSVELAGYAPNPPSDWQVEACAHLLVWLHRQYGVPLEVATTTSGRGLGHHSMDNDTTVEWGHDSCPGSGVINAKNKIVARAREILAGVEDDMATFTDAHAAALTALSKALPDLTAQTAYTDARMEALVNGRATVRSDLKGGGGPVWLVTAVKALETQNAALAAADEARDTALRELLEAHQSGQLSAEAVVAKMGEMLTGAAGTPSTTEPTS